MKIVFDTNVLLSAFVFRGVAAKVYDFCVLHATCFTSMYILDEVQEKLLGKLKIPQEKTAEVLQIIKEKNKIISPNTPLPTVCRDPDDNYILQLAESVKADYLLTGDKDLLVINPYLHTQILNPKQFLDKYMN